MVLVYLDNLRNWVFVAFASGGWSSNSPVPLAASFSFSSSYYHLLFRVYGLNFVHPLSKKVKISSR